MDYEKKYKEALEVAQRFYNNSAAITKKGLEDIFPELAENEDERIRKGLIEYFLHYPDHEITYYGLKADFVIAWLEKQGENNIGISETTKKKLEDNLNKALEKETPESCNEFLDEQGEYNTVVVIPKFRVGDVIRPKGSTTEYTIESISGECYHGKGWGLHISCDDDYELVEQKPSWSEEDEAIYYGVIETEQYMLDVVNGIKKFNVGNISIKEECTRELNWLKSLKERVLPQPKQEWSEEDEERLSDAIFFVREYQIPTRDKRLLNAAKEAEDWLKSLKPQNRWKPSDEQMDMLAKVCSTLHLTSGENEIMESIYDALKKLKA